MVDGSRDTPPENTSNTTGEVSDHALVFQSGSIRDVNVHYGTVLVHQTFGIPAPPRFFGRDAERRKIREVIDQGREHATVLAVIAPPGLGASALVSQTLYDVYREEPGRFPGGRFLVESARYGSLDSMRRVLADLGVETDALGGFEERLERMHREFDRRGAVAVVVERAQEPEHVRPFVATAPGSLTVVASSHDVDLFGEVGEDGSKLGPVDEAESLRLTPLDRESAVRLLCQRTKLKPQDQVHLDLLGGLVELADGSPKVLGRLAHRVVRYTGTALLPDPFTAVRDVLRDEQHDQRRRSSVRRPSRSQSPSVGGRPEGDIPVAAHQFATRLATHPDVPFGIGLATRMAEGASTGRLLAELVEGGVLCEGPGFRHEFVNSAVRHVYLDRGKPGQARSFSAVLDYYLGCSLSAHRVLFPGRWWLSNPAPSPAAREVRAIEQYQGEAEVRGWMERERAALRLTVHEAVRRREYTRAAGLCEALGACWSLIGHLSDVVDTHSRLLGDALESGSLSASWISRLLAQRSAVFRVDGDLVSAERDALESLRQAASARSRVGTTALYQLGEVARAKGDLSSAASRFEDALASVVASTPRDPDKLMERTRALAEVRMTQGRSEEAELLAWQALELLQAEEPLFMRLIAEARILLGDVYAERGLLGKAQAHWAEALHLCEGHGHRRQAAAVCLRRAELVTGVDREAARSDLERAWGHFWALGARVEAQRVEGKIAEES